MSSRPRETFLITAQQNEGLIASAIRQRAGKLATDSIFIFSGLSERLLSDFTTAERPLAH